MFGYSVGKSFGQPTILPTSGPLAVVFWSFIRLGIGLGIGFAFGLSCFMGIIGPSGRQIPERRSLFPNEGVWRSAKNGLIMWLAIGLLVWLGGGLSGGLFFGLSAGLGAGLFAGVFRGGLEAFAEHFILRFFLSQGGDLPLNLVAFLDEAAERLLLRKVGGSYIFVHRQLLDYFAGLAEEE
jgi:hypothetical protein